MLQQGFVKRPNKSFTSPLPRRQFAKCFGITAQLLSNLAAQSSEALPLGYHLTTGIPFRVRKELKALQLKKRWSPPPKYECLFERICAALLSTIESTIFEVGGTQ